MGSYTILIPTSIMAPAEVFLTLLTTAQELPGRLLRPYSNEALKP